MALIKSAKLATQPLFMQSLAGEDPINYDASEFRSLVRATWPTDGIVGATSYHLTQAETVGWSVRVSTGVAVLGGYLVVNPEPLTLQLTGIQTVPIATQHHAVFLVVQDKTVYGDGYYAQIVVSTDEGAGWTVPDAAATLLIGVIGVSPGQTNIQNAHISAKPANASPSFAWVKLTGDILTSAFTSAHTTYADTAEARVRYGNGRVWFSGGIKRVNGDDFPANTSTILGTLPYYLRPNKQVWLPAATSGSQLCRLTVDPIGVVTVHTISTCKYVFLDGVSFEVD